MSFRRIAAMGTAIMLTSAFLALPVSAHGHHGYGRAQDGSGCPVCTVEGCEEEGRHTHDGCYYCGYDHENGYCDGSCETTFRGCYGRHHGCHY